MSSEDKPPTRNTTEELLDALCDLRERIIRWGPEGEKDTDMLRRYAYFVQNSNVGRDCTYAMKSRMEFFSTDFAAIMELTERVNKLAEKALVED